MGAVDAATTLARLFWWRVETTPGADAQLTKRDGVWERSTWSDVATVVRELALGLLALGLRPGDTVALMARSRPGWVQADFAVVSAGGVTVPIYPTYTAEQTTYILNDAAARLLIVEDAATLARTARDRIPRVERIVVMEGGANGDARVITWAALRQLGRDHAERLRACLDERIAAARPEDMATVVYTSGTTGTPKGVVQTHGNHMAMLRALAELPGVQSGDVHLLFLPLAHSFARMEAFLGVHRGLVTAFAEDVDRLGDNLREVRPDFIFGVPRLFEKAHARIVATVEAGSPLRRALFHWALGTGRRVSVLTQARAPLSRPLRAAWAAAQRTVLFRLREAFGGRLRFAVSGGAPLGRELAEFFHAAGLPVLEGYGLTEACPALTWNRLDDFRLGSVGRPVSGVTLRLAPDGEVLARGPNVARGYLNKPDDTAATFDADGWLHTGDIGRLDADGFLYITDRKKDLIVTSGGHNIAPQAIEARLRSAPFIAEAMVYGDRRPYPTALLTLARDEVARFARAHGIAAAEWPTLVRHPMVLDHVQAIIDATNASLPPHAHIRRFAVVPEEFTEAGGELTPTQKVKRRAVADRYREVLDGLYR